MKEKIIFISKIMSWDEGYSLMSNHKICIIVPVISSNLLKTLFLPEVMTHQAVDVLNGLLWLCSAVLNVSSKEMRIDPCKAFLPTVTFQRCLRNKPTFHKQPCSTTAAVIRADRPHQTITSAFPIPSVLNCTNPITHCIHHTIASLSAL